MRALEEDGADCIELGIPFSDPTADGPTVQRSSERALKNPFRCRQFSGWCDEFRSAVPNCRSFCLVISIRFFALVLNSLRAKRLRAGADGVLCVDLPPEESGELKRWTDDAGLDLIFLLSPTSGADRCASWPEKRAGSSTTFQ